MHFVVVVVGGQVSGGGGEGGAQSHGLWTTRILKRSAIQSGTIIVQLSTIVNAMQFCNVMESNLIHCKM